MKKMIALMVLIAATAGCKTTKPEVSVLEQFQKTAATYPVTEEYAKLIAQKELVDINFHKLYQMESPLVITGLEGVSRQELYWFVSFAETSRTSIPLVYMVVIEKSTGKIRFSKSYALGKEWILEAALNGHVIKK